MLEDVGSRHVEGSCPLLESQRRIQAQGISAFKVHSRIRDDPILFHISNVLVKVDGGFDEKSAF